MQTQPKTRGNQIYSSPTNQNCGNKENSDSDRIIVSDNNGGGYGPPPLRLTGMSSGIYCGGKNRTNWGGDTVPPQTNSVNQNSNQTNQTKNHFKFHQI